MKLTRTPLPGGLVRLELSTYGERATVIEAERWIDKNKPDTREHRGTVASVLLSARQQLRERAANQGA